MRKRAAREQVLISSSRALCLTDFGLSRHIRAAPAGVTAPDPTVWPSGESAEPRTLESLLHRQQTRQVPPVGASGLTAYVTTRIYRAPELLMATSDTHSYTSAVDIWSVGEPHPVSLPLSLLLERGCPDRPSVFGFCCVAVGTECSHSRVLTRSSVLRPVGPYAVQRKQGAEAAAPRPSPDACSPSRAGCILAELLLRRPLFHGNNQFLQLAQIVQVRAYRLDELMWSSRRHLPCVPDCKAKTQIARTRANPGVWEAHRCGALACGGHASADGSPVAAAEPPDQLAAGHSGVSLLRFLCFGPTTGLLRSCMYTKREGEREQFVWGSVLYICMQSPTLASPSLETGHPLQPSTCWTGCSNSPRTGASPSTRRL